jgi:hypothetical protein
MTPNGLAGWGGQPGTPPTLATAALFSVSPGAFGYLAEFCLRFPNFLFPYNYGFSLEINSEATASGPLPSFSSCFGRHHLRALDRDTGNHKLPVKQNPSDQYLFDSD